jgi:hypothetical protein
MLIKMKVSRMSMMRTVAAIPPGHLLGSLSQPEAAGCFIASNQISASYRGATPRRAAASRSRGSLPNSQFHSACSVLDIKKEMGFHILTPWLRGGMCAALGCRCPEFNTQKDFFQVWWIGRKFCIWNRWPKYIPSYTWYNLVHTRMSLSHGITRYRSE